MTAHPSGRTRARVALLPVAFLLLPLAAPGAAAAQEPPASYTAAQAETGGAAFAASCARCHEPDLRGNDVAPALVGPAFLASWGGRPAAGLLDFVKTFMPFDEPSSLEDVTYAAIVAYVMSMSGAPAGTTPLAADSPGLFVPAGGR